VLRGYSTTGSQPFLLGLTCTLIIPLPQACGKPLAAPLDKKEARLR